MLSSFFIMDLSLLSMFTYSIKNHPLFGCGNDSYTKKITFLVYNVVVQATNIIKKHNFIKIDTKNKIWYIFKRIAWYNKVKMYHIYQLDIERSEKGFNDN